MSRPGLLGLLAVLATAGPAGAVVLKPTAADIAQVAARGVGLAAARQGYLLKDYVVYAVRDSRGIDPADGEVDAVVLATPLERTRHASFIAAYTGKPISAEEARRKSDVPDGSVKVLVFAHGDNSSDLDFAGKFGPATLTWDTGNATSRATPGEASMSVYPQADHDRYRFVAVVTYAFDLTSVPETARGKARLSFQDGGGKAFDIAVDLATMR